MTVRLDSQQRAHRCDGCGTTFTTYNLRVSAILGSGLCPFCDKEVPDAKR